MVKCKQFVLNQANSIWNVQCSIYVRVNLLMAYKVVKTTDSKLNVKATEFWPFRNATVSVDLKISDVIQN